MIAKANSPAVGIPLRIPKCTITWRETFIIFVSLCTPAGLMDPCLATFIFQITISSCNNSKLSLYISILSILLSPVFHVENKESPTTCWPCKEIATLQARITLLSALSNLVWCVAMEPRTKVTSFIKESRLRKKIQLWKQQYSLLKQREGNTHQTLT